MSYKFALYAFLLLPASLLGQDYHYKLDNRLAEKRSPQFTEDSIRKYIDNYYRINFNFHHQVIRDSYNDCMSRIDSTGLMDSVIASNSVGTPMLGFKLYIGSQVPFEISKTVIDFYYKELQIEGIELIMVMDIPSSVNQRWNSRGIVVVGGSCPYNSTYRYISKREIIEKLLLCDTQKNFIQFFQDHDEEKEKFNTAYKAETERFKNRLRFSGCEEIEDVRARYECAEEKLNNWLRENIVERLHITSNPSYPLHPLTISLKIDKEGKIISIFFPSFLKASEVEELRRTLNTMPNWIAPRVNGEAIECSTTLYIDLKKT